MEAILLALSLQPEVVFLLTDADDPNFPTARSPQLHAALRHYCPHHRIWVWAPKQTENFLVSLLG